MYQSTYRVPVGSASRDCGPGADSLTLAEPRKSAIITLLQHMQEQHATATVSSSGGLYEFHRTIRGFEESDVNIVAAGRTSRPTISVMLMQVLAGGLDVALGVHNALDTTWVCLQHPYIRMVSSENTSLTSTSSWRMQWRPIWCFKNFRGWITDIECRSVTVTKQRLHYQFLADCIDSAVGLASGG